MYEEFYNLKEKPFQLVPNPEYLFLSEKHQNALSYLEYGLTENVGFILLTGEIGSGKTTLIQYLLDRLDTSTVVAVIFNTNVSAEQLLGIILRQFELSGPSNDKAGMLDALYDFLIRKYAERKQVLLIIDEAQNLSDEALEEVRMLSNLQTEEQALLQVMLVGQPELSAKLKRPNLVQFAQRIAASYHLSGLDADETRDYVVFRLEKAGGRPDLFTDEAIAKVYTVSSGIPRSINLLCQAALVYGYADQCHTIDRHIIEQILEDQVGIGLDIRAWTTSTKTAADHEAMKQNGLPQRVQTLETEVAELKKQNQELIRELKDRAENYRKDLTNRLYRLLLQERKRNTALIDHYVKLKQRYDLLQRDRRAADYDLEQRLLNDGTSPEDQGSQHRK